MSYMSFKCSAMLLYHHVTNSPTGPYRHELYIRGYKRLEANRLSISRPQSKHDIMQQQINMVLHTTVIWQRSSNQI